MPRRANPSDFIYELKMVMSLRKNFSNLVGLECQLKYVGVVDAAGRFLELVLQVEHWQAEWDEEMEQVVVIETVLFQIFFFRFSQVSRISVNNGEDGLMDVSYELKKHVER